MEVSIASADERRRRPTPRRAGRRHRRRASVRRMCPQRRHLARHRDRSRRGFQGHEMGGHRPPSSCSSSGAACRCSAGTAARPTAPPSPPPATASCRRQTEPSITLHALDTLMVKVVQEIDGTVLFQGTLVRGESRAFVKARGHSDYRHPKARTSRLRLTENATRCVHGPRTGEIN